MMAAQQNALCPLVEKEDILLEIITNFFLYSPLLCSWLVLVPFIDSAQLIRLFVFYNISNQELLLALSVGSILYQY